ncbi:hypothetical protein Cni_G21586 [Canna indica]|uniref:Bifunctional inhibitor/plant lipid transfer protein/seed storage helical domain-containing protein n=1 Tax=Canna indica TaxID=4628 RepID=A0AAQ3KTE6_9LILI|nr:hypothetical protein Cni_G21586 [Canna indica]
MEKKTLRAATLSLVLLVVLLSAGELAAVAEATDSHCKMTEQGLIACLPAMTNGAAPAKPSPKCCAALAKADLPCLCKYKSNPAVRQLGINPKLAVKLPAKCKLPVPRNCY